jgi:hypothetical protein
VQANLKYSAVLHHVAPLTAELEGLEASLAAGAARLEAVQAELAGLDTKKAELQARLQARAEEAAELKVRAACYAVAPAAGALWEESTRLEALLWCGGVVRGSR